MTEIPKKHRLTGVDISKLSRVSPTKIPSVSYTVHMRQQRTNYRRIVIDVGIIALIVLIAYGASIIGSFVFNDRYIVSYLATKISEESFWSNVIMRAISQPLSQPLLTSSFVCDLQNFGLDASWYHVANIVFHFFSCFLFYILIYLLARRFWQDDGAQQPVHEVALVSAAIFACHPLVCESVAHIAGRGAILSACTIFLTLVFFLWACSAVKIKNVLWAHILTFAFFVQAIYTGVQSLALPFIMLLLVSLLKPDRTSVSNWFKEKWGEAFVIGFLMLIVPLLALPGFTADFSNGFVLPLQSAPIYIASQFRSLIVYYLRCFLLPLGLSIFPPFTTASGLSDPWAILGFLLLLCGVYAVYRLWRMPLAAFGLGLAILGYLPPVFFVQNEIASDCRFYLSIAGLSLVLATFLKPWLFSWKSDLRVRGIVLWIVVLLIGTTIMRSLDFRYSTRLYKVALRVNPADAWAKGMLASALFDAHKADLSMKIAKEAIVMNKLCQPAHFALGKDLLPYKKKPDQARQDNLRAKVEFEQALSLAQSQHLGALPVFECRLKLATILDELGEFTRAKELAEQALLVNPNSIALNLIMGRSLNALGDYSRALGYLNKAYVQDTTNPDIIEPIAECALHLPSPSLINVAYNITKMGLKVLSTHSLNVLFGQAALETGHLDESAQYIELACIERPNDPKALYLRSFVQRAQGKFAQAQESRNRALLLEPELAKKVPMAFLSKDKSNMVTFEDLYPTATRQMR